MSDNSAFDLIVRNQLPESTAIHFHGLELPNAMNGVPYITQAPVRPGESFAYDHGMFGMVTALVIQA